MNELTAALIFVVSILSLSVARPRWWCRRELLAREAERVAERAWRKVGGIGRTVEWILGNGVTPEGMRHYNIDEGESRYPGRIWDKLGGAPVEILEGGTFRRNPHYRDFDGNPDPPDMPRFKVYARAIFTRDGRRYGVNSGLLGSDLSALLLAFTGRKFPRDELDCLDRQFDEALESWRV